MASTVLPNGIIIPEKYSRDWYNDLYHNWQELDNLLAGGGAGGGANDGTLTIQKNGATVGTFSANQATDETIDITVPDVNDGTLTIQQNGTTVDTFTANSSSDKTVNIQCVDLTSNQTVAGNKEFTGTTTAHDVVPSATDTYNFGSSTAQWNNAYIKSLTINGVACGDILAHNASEFVPRSGGAVITGSLFYVTDDAGLVMGGGPDATKGGVIWLLGANYVQRGHIILQPTESSSVSKRMDLAPNGTLTWSGQPIQYGSDARLKQQISEIDDKLLDAWEDVDLVQFKYNDAVKEKSDNARLHTGYVVQQIDKACQSHGVDISQYGLYCHEEYPQETEEVEVEQADGTKVKETKVIREASEHYSLRYTEALIVECKYLRRCIARLTARIEELEKGNKEAEK